MKTKTDGDQINWTQEDLKVFVESVKGDLISKVNEVINSCKFDIYKKRTVISVTELKQKLKRLENEN